MSRDKHTNADAFPSGPAPSQRLITLHRITIEGILVYEGQQWWRAAEFFREGVSDPSAREVSHEVKKWLISSDIPPGSVHWDEGEPPANLFEGADPYIRLLNSDDTFRRK